MGDVVPGTSFASTLDLTGGEFCSEVFLSIKMHYVIKDEEKSI